MAKDELYISVDVEADGRVPGLSSMLSFAAAAFTLEKTLVGTFSRNLDPLEGARPASGPMDFVDKNSLAWAACRVDPVDPGVAMRDFNEWVADVCKGRIPVFVAYPGAYDFKWIDYYCVRFADQNPFGFSGCLDIKAVAWAHLGGTFSHATKRNFPKAWFDPIPHTHVALDDAIGQGALFVNMVRQMRGMPRLGPLVVGATEPAEARIPN